MIFQVLCTQLNYSQGIILMKINKYLQFSKRRSWPYFDYKLADVLVYFYVPLKEEQLKRKCLDKI